MLTRDAATAPLIVANGRHMNPFDGAWRVDRNRPDALLRPGRRRLLASLLALGLPPSAVAGDFPGSPVAYPAVLPTTTLAFPHDYGAHPDFRIEWWYVTGWLSDARPDTVASQAPGAGRRGGRPGDRTRDDDRALGFQLTFFRVRTTYPDDNPSRFSPQRLLIAHAALSDGRAGTHLQQHRLLNHGSPGVRLAEGDTDCALPGWSLARGTDDRYRTVLDEAPFGWELELRPPRSAPWLQGQQGFSRKGPRPEQASHYYSRPQLQVSGQVRLGEDRRSPMLPVSGIAWLDHEWSSALLDERAGGWDWAGLNLHDGRALVWFRIRDADARDDTRPGSSSGSPPDSPAGSSLGSSSRSLFGYFALLEADGRARILAEPGLTLDEHWRSPATGADYPIALSLIPAVPSPAGLQVLKLRPLIPNQEVDSRTSTGNAYWEGAVRVLDAGDVEIGRGYLELTGYHRTIRL